jgi:hypothetical protein
MGDMICIDSPSGNENLKINCVALWN